MRITWHPKNLLLALAVVIAFAVSLTVAINFKTGGIAGVAGLIVYLFLDVILTFMPASWGERKSR